MKGIRKRIDIFCYKHPHFGIPNLIMYVAIGNVILWLFSVINPTLLSYLTFSPYAILHGQIWRIFTFALYPPSTGIFALIAIYFYYMIGKTLENQWGTPLFTIFLLIGVILTELYGFLMYFITKTAFEVTATYIYLSMFFSFAALYPDMQVLLFFIIPIKVKWLAYVDAAFFIYEMIVTPFPANLLPLVAILNFVIFCGGDLLSKIRRNRPTKSTVNFRKEAQRIRRDQTVKLYTHKCDVCGRTDTDYPNLEFRFCSRCAGYHCFCQDHINNHIHFTE